MESKIILILGLLFFSFKFYAQKRENNSSKKNKNKLTGKEIVLELDKLNFFNLTEKKDLKLTKEDFEKSYNELSFFEGYMKDDLSFTDNRFYFIDSEGLFEGGGLIQYLETVKDLFERLGLKLLTSDELNVQTEKHWLHKIKLNGNEYVAFDNDFGVKDWGIAYVNFIEMLNTELKLQNCKEQFYPISSGNDGRIVLLTDKQFKFVQANYPDNNEQPRKISDWKKDYGL